MSDLTESQEARLSALRPFIIASLPALIAQQKPQGNPGALLAAEAGPAQIATLSSDQIVEIAVTACEIANAVIEVIKNEPAA